MTYLSICVKCRHNSPKQRGKEMSATHIYTELGQDVKVKIVKDRSSNDTFLYDLEVIEIGKHGFPCKVGETFSCRKPKGPKGHKSIWSIEKI